MSRKVFLTGATGVVGSSVLPYLLNRTDWQVGLLLRARDERDALRRLDTLCSYVECDLSEEVRRTDWRSRLTALPGDLGAPSLGLGPSAFNRLGNETSHLIHCAADLDLSRPEKEAVESTTAATRRILDLLACNPAAKLEYVSTVGVNGREKAPLTERRMTRQRKFFNSYELAKSRAEELVYAAIDRGHRITIHRPSMIVGNSENGRIIHFQVFYFLLRLAAGLLTRGFIPPLLSRKLDTVPCDFVGRLIFESMSRAELDGRIIHLCSGPELALSLAQIREIAGRHFEAGGQPLPRLRPLPSALFRLAALGQYLVPKSSKLKLRLRLLPQFLSYACQDQIFDNTTTRALFREAEWPIPAKYLDQVISYYCRAAKPGRNG